MTDLNKLSRLLEQATQERLRPVSSDLYHDDEGSVRSHFSAAEHALIAALRNCAEELIRDARRYRWLTRCGAFTVGRATSAPWGLHLNGSATDPADLDAAIDAAIAQEQPL